MTQAQKILNVISQFEDITQKEIMDLMDDSSNINFSARLFGMFKSGLITRKRIEKNGRNTWGYTATGKVLSKREYKRKPKAIDSTFHIELEELREWKRRALIAYPELNVDPLIYKAREIFARHTEDKKLKDDIYSGKLDKRPPMLALIEVLENAA